MQEAGGKEAAVKACEVRERELAKRRKKKLEAEQAAERLHRICTFPSQQSRAEAGIPSFLPAGIKK